jgi:AraC-like DNA-binding protein
LFLFRLILNIAAKVTVCVYGICKNLYGFNSIMFKVEIRKPGEKLLSSKFEESDYPLVNLNFTQNSFRKKYINSTNNVAAAEVHSDEKYLLDIVVPVSLITKMDGSIAVKYPSELALKPASERISLAMRSIISDILHCQIGPEFKTAYLTTKVAELLIQVLSAQVIEASFCKWSAQDRGGFEKVRNLLSQNLKETYSIEELAVVAGMNRTKLQSGFKSLFSKTIYTFALDLKMAQAKALLTKGNQLSLKEIASMLGYKHVNHFSSAFKKKFEISPSEFKRMLSITIPLFTVFLKFF